MAWTARLERLVPDLSATLFRFPVPAAVSILLCLWFNIAGWKDDADARVIAAGAAAFMASGAATLFAEGRTWPKFRSILLALIIGLGAGLAGYLQQALHTNLLFLLPGLVPLIMIAPFLRRGVSQAAIWLYNLRFGLAALLAFVVALLFALGLSALVEALKELFGLGIGDLHEHIWYTAASLVAPVYGLSLMPRGFGEEVDIAAQRGSLLDRGISVLVNYVAAPIIAAYALILHAYAVKIVIDGALPEGQIATMVSVFAIGGTAAWLVAWPWRDQGTRLLRLFMCGWFFLLVVPALLLAIAIWRRLADYGVTPDRYGVVLVAVWAAALVLYLAIRRNRADMRAILGAGAVLLIAGSAGPFGANGLTISSQFERLETLLVAKGILKDGKIASKGLLGAEDSSAGMSILYALKDVDGLGRLRPWFKDPGSLEWNSDSWALAQKLGESFGFSPSSAPANVVSFYSNAPQTYVTDAGAAFMGPFNAQIYYDGKEPKEPTVAWLGKNRLLVRINGRLEVDTDQAWLLDAVQNQIPADTSKIAAIAVEVKPGLTLIVDQIYGNLSADPPLNSLRFWLIQRQQH